MNKLRQNIRCCIFVISILMNIGCSNAQTNTNKTVKKANTESSKSSSIQLGNTQLEEYLPDLKDKRVAIVGNHTSYIHSTHIVDSLLKLGVNIVKVFSPEHGFRGTADAGQKVENQIDKASGLPIISLYGKNKKPTPKQMEDVDVLIFDIQDVGVRFYTYISTLHYVMESAAEHQKKLIVLDRPNPNGHFIDGPILEPQYKSFIGLHPVPVVHGMTIGEYAKMINGERWLKNGVQCQLKVVKCKTYRHGLMYELPISPSPNLPNMASIYLYPSLCFFEGTPISVGRGTSRPFQHIGHPSLKQYDYSFTPQPNEGARYPKLKNEECFGISFSELGTMTYKKKNRLDLSYLIEFYKAYPNKSEYFTDFFNLLAGNSSLQRQIKEGKSELGIRATWKKGLAEYDKMRQKYILYD